MYSSLNIGVYYSFKEKKANRIPLFNAISIIDLIIPIVSYLNLSKNIKYIKVSIVQLKKFLKKKLT